MSGPYSEQLAFKNFDHTCPSALPGLPGLLFSQMVQSIITAQCLLSNLSTYPPCSGSTINNEDEFDFIVVGAGTAGAVVASRLSEVSKWKVALIEAGDNPSALSEIPGFMFSTHDTEMDWGYRSEPNFKSCLSMVGGNCALHTGKGLGGSSAINSMLYTRGNPTDYTHWEKLGNSNWGSRNVLEYFRKLENYGVKNGNHNNDGPQLIQNFSLVAELEPLKTFILGGFAELGFPINRDFTGESQIGFGKAYGTVEDGKRANTAKMYLKTRDNLQILKNVFVEKVIFEENKAVGIMFSQKDNKKIIKASKEIIISAGAVNSPKILQLSGIGPKKDLEKFSIKVVSDLNGVGKNLQDHPIFAGFSLNIKYDFIDPSPQFLYNALFSYISKQNGYFGSVGLYQLLGFIDTDLQSLLPIPNIQFNFLYSQKNDFYTLNDFSRSMHFNKDISDQFGSLNKDSDLLLIMPSVLNPKSRGSVSLRSSDPVDSPIINLNLLDADDDILPFLKALDELVKFSKTKSFSFMKPEQIFIDVKSCSHFKKNSKDFWGCYLRHLTGSSSDLVGTCKMGTPSDPDAVVSSDLKVYGVQGLRVIDASIMPEIVRSSVHIPTIMIAEKASDMIVNEWNPRHTEL